jgi:hypothetical protein
MQPVPTAAAGCAFHLQQPTSTKHRLRRCFSTSSQNYQFHTSISSRSILIQNIIGGKMSATVEHATCPECPAAHQDLESGLLTSTAEASILAGEGQQVGACPPSPLYLLAKP